MGRFKYFFYAFKIHGDIFEWHNILLDCQGDIFKIIPSKYIIYPEDNAVISK